jgi:hypothetical protein
VLASAANGTGRDGMGTHDDDDTSVSITYAILLSYV